MDTNESNKKMQQIRFYADAVQWENGAVQELMETQIEGGVKFSVRGAVAKGVLVGDVSIPSKASVAFTKMLTAESGKSEE